MVAASTMRDFLACPAPTVGSSAACHGRLRVSWKIGIPCYINREKNREIARIQPSLAKIGLKNICEFSYFGMNYLLNETVN